MEKETRVKQITRTSIIGIVTNIFLSAFKATVGLISGSIAIVLDAVNNLTDALSSVITIAGIKLARKSPDKTHPFGYGRVEYMSAIVITGIVFAAGLTSLIESVKKIIHPQIPEYSTAAVIVVVAAIVVKLLLGKYVSKQGQKYNSDALKASGADASFDALISLATLAGVIITILWN
ncbi:MAG: cation diffusion facilitator family transporter, partial [Bacteroidales bacterium]|nr:cation diffusion facilitator family transporter [Bacteroidales bacterium]